MATKKPNIFGGWGEGNKHTAKPKRENNVTATVELPRNRIFHLSTLQPTSPSNTKWKGDRQDKIKEGTGQWQGEKQRCLQLSNWFSRSVGGERPQNRNGKPLGPRRGD